MYKKIGDYGIIGNLQSVALVGKDGSIDWLCLPNIDSPSVFAALLDADDGGFFSITPEGEWDSVLNYREDSNVLVGSFRTRSGRYNLTDFMTIPEQDGSPSAERDFALIRLLKVERGTVRVRVSFQPRFDYGRVLPACTLSPGCGVIAIGKGEQVTLCTGRELQIVGAGAEGVWELTEGERVAICLRYGCSPEELPEEKAERSLVETLDFWRAWLYQGGTGFYNDIGAHRNQVVRSLLVLKLLCQPNGTMAAAATTSLPEEIGGVRNWDYRFSWVRDTCMALTALFQVGHVREAQSYLDWLREIIGKNERRELQVMYRMDGATDLEEFELPHLEGFRGSQPVRVGNQAAEQKQFSIYGNVLIAAHLVVSRNRSITSEAWNGLRLMADYAQRQWREPDWSIWEMRAEPRHFVHSKVMCWATLDRCLRIARATGSQGEIELWQQTRDEIHREVMSRGWNDKRQSFVLHYDTEALDGSTLLMSMCGFISYDHPRMLATVEALRMDLANAGFLYRYFADDGLPGKEGTFLACTLWLIINLAKQGEIDEADLLLTKVDQVAGPLHLLAEEYDPQWQEQLGNFPQAFSHEAYITAATAIAHAKGERARRAEVEQYLVPEPDARWEGGAPSPGELAALLEELFGECCNSGRPDYGKLRSREFALRLASLLNGLEGFCLERLKGKEERISFWCNLYNLLLVHGVLAAGIEVSVQEIPRFYRRIGCQVGRHFFTLEIILHGILRGNRPVPGRFIPPLPPGDGRLTCSIRPADPRVLLAVHTATVSSPPLTVLKPGTVDEDLDRAARRFLREEAQFDLGNRRVVLPRIFKWYDDFGMTHHDVTMFVARFAPEPAARAVAENPDAFVFEYPVYDWRL